MYWLCQFDNGSPECSVKLKREDCFFFTFPQNVRVSKVSIDEVYPKCVHWNFLQTITNL